ncbi:biotin-dependent carboxyltransferase family protein [Paenibacillus solani]|uniref:Urea amidolyase n=1 Tax=Paenibacillus solani TaxID=1705565 RepID=A0A0M1P5H6_9BACL|nr:biotin-dependent carboxyltransferase family protein [Paenibacillus solani]KOR89741.1 urea amidolyase [Paenibacillus solani]
MSITVIKPGLLVTLQDTGRYGYGKFGISPAGAMDSFAYLIANRLVGNEDEQAALEITWSGFAVEFERSLWVAITGGDLTPTIDGERVPMWRPVLIKAGSCLSFQQPVAGCRAYLAVSGGFDVPIMMNSYSTYLRAGIGGYEGRALKKGDTLSVRLSRLPLEAPERFLDEYGGFFTVRWFVSAGGYTDSNREIEIRVLKGRQYDDFDEFSQQALFDEFFTVTPQSDRMGYRLSGPTLQVIHSNEYISEPVAVGTVQVPADGQLIILMADRQTLGGYPKIAQIASVDIPLLAQLPAGGKIRFREISLPEAEQLSSARIRELRLIEAMIKRKLKEW